MKFYLLKQATHTAFFTSASVENLENFNNPKNYITFYNTQKSILAADGASKPEIQNCENLQRKLYPSPELPGVLGPEEIRKSIAKMKMTDPENLKTSDTVFDGIPTATTRNIVLECGSTFGDNCGSISICFDAEEFQEFQFFFGLDATLEMELVVGDGFVVKYPDVYQLTAKNMRANSTRSSYECSEKDVHIIPGPGFRTFSTKLSSSEIPVEHVSTKLTLCFNVSSDCRAFREEVKPASAVNKDILENEIFSDLIIRTEDGDIIKCHRSFVAVHSPVLQAMLETEMQKKLTGEIEMEDISGKCVRALLKFLYYGDIAMPRADPGLGFELLQAAHKYDIPALERAMQDLLLIDLADKIGVGLVIKLFCFARRIPHNKGLKDGIVKVLKMNCADVDKTTEFEILFKKDCEAAMDLCKAALSS